ncbi:hypothetical protein NQ176_g3452 [Zarea fungicola]|uniref:Uncharacterized protein n=1 Tax=Zarea fungicola TaxID=93591 RepID=A0ACC1NKH3_9HYPO|nr:hypothetical protein NQ176_g3452 [Lecanicillium fungicola]
MAVRLLFLALLSFFALLSSAQSDGNIVFGFSDLDLGYFEENGDLRPNTTNMLAMNYNSTDLIARKNDHVCAANVGGGWQSHCYGWVGAAGTIGIFATNLANTIITASQNHECGYYTDYYGPLSVAIHTDAPNCHTTSQRATIEGAITKWIHKNLPYGSCNVQCIHIDHYGNWHGYIAFGDLNDNINKVLETCISVHQEGNCVSGGKYDRDPH